MLHDNPVVGIFDSGVGGLTVVREVRRALPALDVVYLGDTARVPYGNKSLRTVERYALACQRFLLSREVSLVMIACNTASASALPALRQASPVPVIGAVEPGARSAVATTRGGRIGVIGTLATISSGAYDKAVHDLAPSCRVTSLACPLLVPLAEEGWVDDEIARAVAQRYLQGLFVRDPEIDTLVLGCTHYPLLRGVLKETADRLSGRDIAVVDSSTAMADAAVDELGASTASAVGRLFCHVTDTSRLDELGPRFLGHELDGFELIDL